MAALADLTPLGVGLGYRAPFRADLFASRERVDFLEVIADHYFDAAQEKLDELDLLANHFTLIPHGLDLSIGSAEGIDSAYLDRFAALIDRLDPPYWSEHLSFTRAGGVSIGHLACLPYTREAVDAVVRNVEIVRRRIKVPLILENITATVLIPGAEMDEPAFVDAVLSEADCGWLCDVTNLFTNAVNEGRDVSAELDRWPWERVVQMHFAGGRISEGVLIDSHDGPTSPEVWRLLEAAVARSKVKGIILERDERLPPFGQLLDELDKARAIGRWLGRWP
ncbi:DUF692 domain-containing protein [Methylocapsa sp. S129]|uniref:DUF692 domain-containing protein n=1 Tax=Methylocapsa sp. S129 TaxID=1641869 RepID=UPI00131D9F78|nr:DUF692 domain-containing protein [Methylocapsa sp. S129]